MNISRSISRRWTALLLVVIVALAALPPPQARATPLAQAAVSVELIAVEDSGVIESVPTFSAPSNPYFVLNSRPGGDFDHNFMRFDLSALPADATISSAQLQVYINAAPSANSLNVELGRVDADWSQTTLNWNNQPAIAWSGASQTVTGVGPLAWPLAPLLQAWLDGSQPNHGVAIRGQTPNTGAVQADTIDAADDPATDADGFPPRLVVTYTVPPSEGAQPDLGDAPDSSNHHGVNNTAYPGAGVLGQFPTVWDTPAGQAAGPRHANQTGEGILGQYLSRENEADLGPDQDTFNNIVRNAASGAVGDVADNDRGDDGWRNRNIRFFDCQAQTLTVRVSKATNATLDSMYLNVWFDGNRDGDWDDNAMCSPFPGLPLPGFPKPSSEWIVQDHIIDMTAIPAGGFLDFNITTRRVLNTTEGNPHWMRFTLSEERAVQTANGQADGRGPHPSGALGAYKFGETEDVLQTPPPPGEPGELVLEKRVITSQDPVDYAGVVTYQIRLRHVGGSQPIQAQIRDQIGYPQHLLPGITDAGDIVYVEVTSATGGAAPLQADLTYVQNDTSGALEELVSWQGTLQPDAEILLSFDVHVHPLCESIQQTEAITNIAEARLSNGNPITAEASFVAKCPGYDADGGIQIDDSVLNPNDPADWTHYNWQGMVWNKHPRPVTLDFYQELGSPGANGSDSARMLHRVTLGPNEKKLVRLNLQSNIAAADAFIADDAPLGKLTFCILPGEDGVCPDAQQFPNMVGELAAPQPDDLGDAPDSSNHFAVPMTAYPGVEAHFPTVFAVTTGAPEGPKHHNPGTFHLGPGGSKEAEADVGPDADGVNNITPPANVSNQDWFDDGSRLSGLNDCQPARADAQIAVSPQALNWFIAQGQPAYLNVWIDSNRDGDWEDGFTCVDASGQNKEVVEHILIDHPINVAALGAGLSNLPNIPTELVSWPQQFANQPAWVRFTLSERPSNKTLNFGAITYGDGRGFANAFAMGETEDHLLQPGGAGDGPDLAARLNGRLSEADRLAFRIDYANLGAQPAAGGRLVFQKPEQLRDVSGMFVQAPGIPAQNIVETGADVSINLPNMAAGANGTVVIGWDLAALAAASRVAGENYTARVQITQEGDSDTSNNAAEVTVATPAIRPIIAAVAADGAAWGMRETTCRSDLALVGRSAPGVPYDLMLDGNITASVTAISDGTSNTMLNNLSDGRHGIRLEAAQFSRTLLVDVDSSLPVDPLSLAFTDSQGRTIHPPTLGWPLNASNAGVALRSGETYTVGIDSCVNDPNMALVIVMHDILISSLRDDDGDGRYTGSFVYNAPAQRAAQATQTELRFDVAAGSVALSFAVPLTTLTPGTVTDALTGAPVADAAVAALEGTTFTAWPAAALGQPNPQATDANGNYSFVAPGDENRLNVAHGGYQPYRSSTLVAANGVLNRNIALTPELAGTPTHTIYVTENGFVPAVLRVQPGSVIEWVNVDLTEHSANGQGWDSGALDAGASYRTRMSTSGSFSYQDAANPLNTATIIVGSGKVFLPLIGQ